MRLQLRHIGYALTLMCGSITFGATITFFSAAISNIKEEIGDLPRFEEAAFSAAPAIAAIFSPFLVNLLLLKVRRKIMAFATGVCGVVFWLLLLTLDKDHFWAAIVVRVLIGLVLGSVSLVCPMYIVEITPPEQRGFYGVLHQTALAFGHVLFNLLGAAHYWRCLVYVAAGFLVALSCLVWLLPESSADIDRKEKKKDMLDDAEKPRRESLFQRKYTKNIIVSMACMVFQQWSGIIALITNMAPMLSEVGLDVDPAYQAAIATSAEFIASLTGAFVMDKFGRRKIWMFSSVGCVASLLIYALNVKFGWSAWLPMFMLFGYLLCFGVGLGAIPWFMGSAMFKHSLRASANSLVTATHWFCASLITFGFPYIEAAIGQFGLMMILMSVCICAFIFGIFFVWDKTELEQEEQEEVQLSDIGEGGTEEVYTSEKVKVSVSSSTPSLEENNQEQKADGAAAEADKIDEPNDSGSRDDVHTGEA